MEYFLAASVIGAGYALNNNGKNRNNEPSFISNVPKNQLPNGNNIYNNESTINIRQNEQERANKLFAKTKNSEKTNVMIAGPPMPIFNKVDYADNNLPIEYVDSPMEHQKKNMKEIQSVLGINGPEPVSGGFQGISLTGEPINPKNFVHNNMVPFFGSCIKQNVDENTNRTKLETFTGSIDNYQEKKEIAPMFKPQTNISNPYGAGNLDGYMNNRYVVGPKRSNVTPIEKVYVGPGLNQGYTSKPTGGFQQPETRDYVLPKTTNETRVKTNPKVSYQGRIIAGEKISKPGKIGEVQKNLPNTFFEETPDMYFTTTGAVLAAKQRPDIVMKDVNRPRTEKKKRVGPAAPTTGSNEKIRSKVQNSHKKQLCGPGYGVANSEGSWVDGKHNYGKNNIRLKKTIRQKTGRNNHSGNVQTTESQGSQYRNCQGPRRTRKTNVVGNARWTGNMQGPQNRSTVYDPNDIARTTIKETNINNNRTGNLDMEGPSRSPVYDPNDIARTTIKETNIHDNRTGNLEMQGPSRNPVYDPNDIAKTTIKETNIHDNRTGNLEMQGPAKNPVYDPNDITRTTIKETNIHNNRTGNMNSFKKPLTYDPNDILKTTMKETAMASDLMGNVNKQARGDAYKIKEMEAVNTNRQFTSTDYTGNSQLPEDGAYKVTDVNAPNTNRQFTSDKEYSGIAGAGSDGKPPSYADIYNATIKSLREDVAVGRVPAAVGTNQPVSAADIKMSTRKVGDLQNKHLTDRGVMSTKVYNSLPQKQDCSVTKDRESVPNKPLADRLDPAMLDQFKRNPYTQPLDSYFYN